MVERLWQVARQHGGPLIEPRPGGQSLVTVLWQGEAASTVGEFGLLVPLGRVAGTDPWGGAVAVASPAPTLYYLAPDGAHTVPADASGTGRTHVDPLNANPLLFPADPHDATDRDCWASVLELADAPPEPWLARVPPGGRGTCEPVELASP